MSRLQSLLSPLTQSKFWRERSVSERRTLSIAASLLLLMLAFQLLLKPWLSWQRALQTETELQASQLIELRRLMQSRQLPTQAPSAAVQSAAISLPALVERELTQAGVKSALKKLDPIDNEQVRVELGGVNFNQTVTVLEKLAREQKVQIEELSVDAVAPSTVTARFTLKR
jgi:type II secretory pathway component PulM